MVAIGSESTEALKRHDKNIFYLVITSYKSLNRLSISRYDDLYKSLNQLSIRRYNDL